MTKHNHDIQGYLFGFMPYDFRRPSIAKIGHRLYRPGGPMWAPKVYGVGWTLNFAHRGTHVLLAACAAAWLVSALIA
jgi:hypothetical protein